MGVTQQKETKRNNSLSQRILYLFPKSNHLDVICLWKYHIFLEANYLLKTNHFKTGKQTFYQIYNILVFQKWCLFYNWKQWIMKPLFSHQECLLRLVQNLYISKILTHRRLSYTGAQPRYVYDDYNWILPVFTQSLRYWRLNGTRKT